MGHVIGTVAWGTIVCIRCNEIAGTQECDKVTTIHGVCEACCRESDESASVKLRESQGNDM